MASSVSPRSLGSSTRAASALFGVEGLRVTDAEREADGSLTVWVVTDHPGAALCPDCGTASGRVHEHLLTPPRDLRRGLGEGTVAWGKRQGGCGNEEGARGRCTGALPPIGCAGGCGGP